MLARDPSSSLCYPEANFLFLGPVQQLITLYIEYFLPPGLVLYILMSF